MYSTDFYRTTENGLAYICSVSGSDAPWHFENVKSIDDVNNVLKKLEDEDDVHVWYSWPVPWEDSRGSDDCVIFEVLEKKWWQFWKNKSSVKVWKDTYYEKYKSLNNTRQMYFTDTLKDIHTSNYGADEHWQLDRLKLFTLPQMRFKK